MGSISSRLTRLYLFVLVFVGACKVLYSRLENLLDNFNSKANEIIRKATEKQILVTDTPCDLLAVNVYDAIFHDNYIISRYFVMFGSMENQQIEYGDFVIETNAYKKVTRIYRI